MKLYSLLLGVSLLALGAQATPVYSISYGTGTAPFQYDTPPSDYQVTATGIQNHQGVHGFDLQHNGADTYVDMPGQNYYITFLQVGNQGQVSGTFNANFGGYGCNAFFWQNGQLSVFDSHVVPDCHVADMNDLGLVVGSCGAIGGRAGFIWDQGVASQIDLTPLLGGYFQYNGQTFIPPDSTSFTAVNDAGQILGSFGARDKTTYAFTSFWCVLTPISAVPEPSVLSLFALGMAGLMKFRSRSQK